MSRLIDADELVKWLQSPTGFRTNCEDCTSIDCLDCIIEEAIANAPTIDAEPVRHGTWETSFEYDWDGNKLYIHFHRECGFEYRNYIEDEQPYCPHCGVKMDGGGKR